MITEVNIDADGQELPDNKCPNCGTFLNAASETLVDRRGERPRRGDLSICYVCGTMMEFTSLMLLRELRQDEIDALDPEMRQQLLDAVNFVKDKNPG